jgi:hypothetical protein
MIKESKNTMLAWKETNLKERPREIQNQVFYAEISNLRERLREIPNKNRMLTWNEAQTQIPKHIYHPKEQGQKWLEIITYNNKIYQGYYPQQK